MQSLITATTLLVLFAWAKDHVPQMPPEDWGSSIVSQMDQGAVD
jgi:hypothetical protein